MTPRNALVLLRGVTWTAVASITGCAVVIGGAGVALGPATTGSVALAASYALLAAAATFTLDEPAAPIVDVTPTGRLRHTAIRSYALSVPLTAGAFLVAAVHARDGSQPAPDLVVAAVGNLLLGFAVACAARRRSDEPGMWAATAITLLLVIPPGLGPVARLIQTFPNPSHTASLSSNTWWSLAIAGSLTSIPASTLRWRPFSRLKRWPTPFRLAATPGPHPESLHTTTSEMTRTPDTEVHLRRSDDAVRTSRRPRQLIPPG